MFQTARMTVSINTALQNRHRVNRDQRRINSGRDRKQARRAMRDVFKRSDVIVKLADIRNGMSQ